MPARHSLTTPFRPKGLFPLAQSTANDHSFTHTSTKPSPTINDPVLIAKSSNNNNNPAVVTGPAKYYYADKPDNLDDGWEFTDDADEQREHFNTTLMSQRPTEKSPATTVNTLEQPLTPALLQDEDPFHVHFGGQLYTIVL